MSTFDAGSGARPGLELLRVRRNNIGFINDPINPKQPVLKMTLLTTKKDRHTFTLADWWRDDVYPRVLNRHSNCNDLDYLFFPKVENRQKIFERIKKNFEGLSNELRLFIDSDGQNRPIYVLRHSSIQSRRNKGIDANVVAMHSNTSVQMIDAHYDSQTDKRLLEMHNQLNPERNRTKNANYKKDVTKKQ